MFLGLFSEHDLMYYISMVECGVVTDQTGIARSVRDLLSTPFVAMVDSLLLMYTDHGGRDFLRAILAMPRHRALVDLDSVFVAR